MLALMTTPNGAIRNRVQRLEDLTHRLLDGRRLIIASNRGPVQYDLQADGTMTSQRGSGGMVTALLATAGIVPMTWVAAAMTEGDRRAAADANGEAITTPGEEVAVKFVTVPNAVYQRHYYVLCNPLLWFIQHFMWNTPRTPNIGRAVYEAWESGYIPVNQAIADAVADEAAKSSTAPVILLQDYHLYLAPAMIRERVPEAMLLHFTHIPWPGPRYWGLLPEFMRRGIHEAMCSNDIIGLQTRGDVLNFLHCAEVILDADVDHITKTIRFRGRTVFVRQYPISIDSGGLLEYKDSPEVLEHVAKLRPLLELIQALPKKSRTSGLWGKAYDAFITRAHSLIAAADE